MNNNLDFLTEQDQEWLAGALAVLPEPVEKEWRPMTPKTLKYNGYVSATWNGKTQIEPVVVSAASNDDALRQLESLAYQLFPKREGWMGHEWGGHRE